MDDTKQKAKELFTWSGIPVMEFAPSLGISGRTIYRWASKENWQRVTPLTRKDPKPRKHKRTAKVIQEARRAYTRSAVPVSKIAESLGISATTIYRLAKEENWPRLTPHLMELVESGKILFDEETNTYRFIPAS